MLGIGATGQLAIAQFQFANQGGGGGGGGSGGGNQFLIGGPDLTENFVTSGTISAMNVSYTINPLSRRTV